MSKFKTFLEWVGKKQWRWLIVLVSGVVLIFSVAFGTFLIMSGYDSERGLHKDPVNVDVKIEKKIEKK